MLLNLAEVGLGALLSRTGVRMRRKNAVRVAWFIAAFLGGLDEGARAVAQSASRPNPAPLATTATIDVIADLIYDTNVAQSGAFLASRRGLRLSDVSARPSVAVNLGRRLGRQTLFLQGSAGYDFYDRNRILNRERIDAHSGVLLVAGPCSGTISGDYGRRQSELADLALVNKIPELNIVRNTEETKKADITGECGAKIGLAPTFDVSETWNNSNSTLLKASDSSTFSTMGGLAYQRPTFGKISVTGSYSAVEFPNRGNIVGGVAFKESYRLYAGGLSYERRIGARLDGTFSASYTSLVLNIPGAKGFRGLTYSADGSYQLDPRLQLKLTIARATLPSSRVDATFSVNTSVTSELEYTVSQRLLLRVGGGRVHRNYPGALGTAGLDLTQETVYSGHGDATYSLNRRISLGLNVTYTQRNANFQPLTYSGTNVALSIKSTF